MNFLYQIPGRFSYVDHNDSKRNDYIYYVVFDPIQWVNRERKDGSASGSICIGTPLFFFRKNRISEGDTIEIIKKDHVNFKSDSFIELLFIMDKIYDLEIDRLTIFRPEKFKFPKKENRDFKLGEILKTEIN